MDIVGRDRSNNQHLCPECSGRELERTRWGATWRRVVLLLVAAVALAGLQFVGVDVAALARALRS